MEEEEEELPALGVDSVPAVSRERVSTPRVSTTRCPICARVGWNYPGPGIDPGSPPPPPPRPL